MVVRRSYRCFLRFRFAERVSARDTVAGTAESKFLVSVVTTDITYITIEKSREQASRGFECRVKCGAYSNFENISISVAASPPTDRVATVRIRGVVP